MLVVQLIIREVNCLTALGERSGICVEQREAQGGKNRVDFPWTSGYRHGKTCFTWPGWPRNVGRLRHKARKLAVLPVFVGRRTCRSRFEMQGRSSVGSRGIMHHASFSLGSRRQVMFVVITFARVNCFDEFIGPQ